jgi:hypothetical protein
MTFTHALSTNNYGPAKFIVDALVANGTHTTIASALTSASSGDTIFLRPGTYTENITLKAGDAFTPNVTIIGTCTFTAAGSVSISGIRLQTNSAFFLAVTGTAASVVNLTDCFLNCTNNTGISHTSSDTGSSVNIFDCNGNIGTTGISLFASTSAGFISLINAGIGNSGASTTASTVSAGTINSFRSNLAMPITTSGTGLINFFNTTIQLGTNTTVITTAGTGATNTIVGGTLISGTASAVSVGSGTTLSIYNTAISSSNAAAITGAGTLVHSGLAYSNTSSVINTTTITNRSFGRTGTWTPGVAFGGGTTGITYSFQGGNFTMIGNAVFINGAFITTNKGSSTGTATLTGLPITAGASAQYTMSLNLYAGLTVTATYTTLGLQTAGATTTATMVASSPTAGGASIVLTDAMFANATTMYFSGFYLVA